MVQYFFFLQKDKFVCGVLQQQTTFKGLWNSKLVSQNNFEGQESIGDCH